MFPPLGGWIPDFFFSFLTLAQNDVLWSPLLTIFALSCDFFATVNFNLFRTLLQDAVGALTRTNAWLDLILDRSRASASHGNTIIALATCLLSSTHVWAHL